MNIEACFYLVLVLNLGSDIFFYLNENIWEANIFKKVIPELKKYAGRDYDWQKELDYKRWNRKFSMISSISGFVIAMALFGTGLFSHIMLLIHNHFSSPFWTGSVFAITATVALFIYRLPFSFYHTFVLEEKYGFNRKNLPLFIKDSILSLALSIVIVPPLMGTVNLLSGKEGGILFIFLVMVSFSLLFSFIFPVVIMPLFYRIKPLEKGTLEEKIQALLDRTGLSIRGVYTADQSRRSAHANAMVAGFGSSKRIILFDTLLEKMDENEILSVLAHELGHWKERHIFILQAAALVEQAILFLLLGLMWNSSFSETVFGLAGMTMPRLVILLFILSGIMGLILSPLENILSRKLEFRADSFAMDQTAPEHFSSALSSLASNDLAWIPASPLHSIWFSSHPSIPERILSSKDRG
jgi:STE24 endopeptidase